MMGNPPVPVQFPSREQLADPLRWTQRVEPLQHAAEVLREHGVDAGAVLQKVGLAPDALRDPEARVPFMAVARFLVECVHATRCEHFGLLVGSRVHLAHLGFAGELARHCATVGEALRAFTLYQQLNAQGASPYLVEQPASVRIGWAVFHPRVEIAYPMHDLVMAAALNVLRELLGRAPTPTDVTLPRLPPRDKSPYLELFRCPVRFEAGQATVGVPAGIMRLPVPGADPARAAALQAEARRWLDRSFEATVHRAIGTLLMKGMPGGDALAQQLAMHRRTLNRRLRSRGTTFQALLDEVRFAYARQLLADTGLTVGNIAITLGYAESSTFSRAFRRWSDCTPLEWRAARRTNG